MKTEAIQQATTLTAMAEGRARPGPALAAADRAAVPAAPAADAARAAAEANRRLAEKGSQLTIEFDDALDRAVFRLVDSQTGEVVRQIPSEEVLAIARALAEGADAGVMLSTNA
ncbi:MAG: flagellar protein FlaG [Burkholderiales bacterium]|nr:flagellar protein FlaG [Burkholderiales bacterium]MCA3216804.1 flagellar protein FlaG [Burkholderiales bacterium]